jgi:hypothetical protein
MRKRSPAGTVKAYILSSKMVWCQMEQHGKGHFRILVGLILCLLAGWHSGFAATLVWDPNPPGEGIAHYTVYVESSGAPIQTNLTTSTSVPLTQLIQGILYTLRVTATDTNGVESFPSSIDFVIPLPPEITLQPLSKVLSVGNALSLNVGVTGTPPFSYQWLRDGVAIPGQTNQSLAISAVALLDAGDYTVQVTNAAGSVVSTAATVTVTGLLSPPTITAQPQSITVGQGAQIALAVTAAGPAPLSYQWYKDGVELTGRTAASLVITSASASNAGSYRVRVSNLFGFIDSANATVTVQTSGTAPTIVTQPASASLAVGDPLTLQVLASGSAPLSYQWFKDGAQISGQTSQTFSIASVASSNSGAYRVVISNPIGSVTSIVANVSILTAPVLVNQPSGTTLLVGQTLVLSVQATGSQPLTYQWFRNGQLISDLSGSTLTIPSVTLSDAGLYSVIVSNGAGSVTSAAVPITVTQTGALAPRIITQPLGITLNEGLPVSLFVEAEGQAVLQFAWYKDGQALPGKTNAVLSFTSIAKEDEGMYTVRVSNGFGTASSEAANIVVFAFPRIVSQPDSVAVPLGNSFQLTVGATSSETLSYQWLKDGVEIPGATETIYRVFFMQASHAGVYQARVSNSKGFVLSQQASVTVAVAPQITQQPSNATVNEGATLRLSFQASGSEPFEVEWLRNNIVVLVTNKTELTISDVKPTDGGSYVARVSGPGGTITTSPVIVRVEPKPVITLHPQSAAVQIGANVTLTVSASGNGILSYQWFKDGQAIVGAQTIYLTVSIRSKSDLGTYTVRVSNAAGFTESNPAILQILAAPAVSSPPASVDVLVGNPFTLAVGVEGTIPLSYQWFRNGAALAGANSGTLSVSAASAADAGVYHLVVTNSLGSAQSTSATVRVVPHIIIARQPADSNAPLGSPVTLSVEALSELPLSYIWFHDDVELEGQSGPILQIPSVSDADAGTYHVLILNDLEEVTTQSAELTVASNSSAGRLSITATASGVTLFGQGEPGATYDVQLSHDLSADDWTDIQTVSADLTGRFQIVAPTSGRYWFIRTVRQ